MKTSISHNGYSIHKEDLSRDSLESIKKDLTVSPNNSFMMEMPTKEYYLYQENSKKIYVPRFFGLQRFGIPKRDILSNHIIHCSRMVFRGQLRPEQLTPVNAFLEAANDPLKRGGIISVPCAGGKTVMAIYCACQIQKKTLFISHKDFLSTQFEERVGTFVPDATVGIIKQNKVIVDDKDFVVASLQSIAMRNYDPDIFKQFGLVIIDECHHMSAEVFSRALLKINAPIMMGLSATLNRKDGLRKVFEWFLGKSVLRIKKNAHIDSHMEVRLIEFLDDDLQYREIKRLWNGKLNAVAMLNNICNYMPRTQFIVDIITDIFDKEPNRKLIVLSERRSQLNQIEQILGDKFLIGYYVGGMSRNELKKSEEKKIILATYQMASEGMDIPALDTLILASPITSIEQSIGRIQRQKQEDRSHIPLTIDIIDSFSLFKKKAATRQKYYESKKYSVNHVSKRINYSFLEEEEED
eukprot:762920-Hanusia_phi.AAC.1